MLNHVDEYISKQMVKSTRVIALIAGLLLFAGQQAALVHAADHPFHDTSEICTSFISLEQHDTAVTVIALAADFPRYSDAFETGHQLLVYISHFNSNHARAPPLTT